MQKFAQDKQKTLEVVSKPQVRLKSKAQTDRRDEQYILKRFATQLLGLRWGFETASRNVTAVRAFSCYQIIIIE
jgi:hypothetical protein